MSTNINISVGDSKLLNKARLQQNASRQAQLEKEADRRLKDQATKTRTASFTTQGRDANGNPITGVPLTQPETDRSPAATRSDPKEFFLLRPTAGPADGQIPLTSKKLPEVLFTDTGEVTFSASVGPSGSTALQAIPFANDEQNFVFLYNEFPEIPISAYATRRLKDYTLQMFVKLGETYTVNQTDVICQIVLTGQSVVNNAEYFFSLLMYADLSTVDDGYSASSFRFTEGSSFAGDTEIYNASNVDLASDQPKVAPGAWNHLAMTKKGLTLAAFLNGQLLATATSTLPVNSFLRGLSYPFVSLSFGQGQKRIVPAQPVSIHGLRFDTKCLYTANFTPPPNL